MMKSLWIALSLSLAATALPAATGHDYFAAVSSPGCKDLGQVQSPAYRDLLEALRAQARAHCHGMATCWPDYERYRCADSRLTGVAWCSCLF